MRGRITNILDEGTVAFLDGGLGLGDLNGDQRADRVVAADLGVLVLLAR